MKKIILILLALLAACDDGQGANEKAFSGKNLAITVSGSRSFNPNVVHGQIDYYQITIAAPDLKIPFSERFGGDSDSAKMLGIPTGGDRTITIEAYNPNGLVIRRGKKEGVSIVAGKLSHIEIVMHSVPIFTNLADKGAVSKERLSFGVFGEPGSRLQVYHVTGEEGEEAVRACRDRKTDKALVNTAEEDGLFWLEPKENFEEGVQSFRVGDMDSGELSQVIVTLYETITRPGIAINSGGYVKKQGEDLVLAGIGQPTYREVSMEDENLGGETLLDVIDLMY